MKNKYNLYIDENGNSDMSCSGNNRFLALTGIVISDESDRKEFKEKWSFFKKTYKIENLVLHRADIVNKTKGFEFLQNIQIASSFNEKLLHLINDINFKTITCVIDKEQHLKTYKEWHQHPYYYCLINIMERYLLFLRRHNSTGTVTIESQGKKEDKALSDVYKTIYQKGTDYISSEHFKKHITNSQLKLATKNNVIESKIYGLELCDIVAHLSMQYVRELYNLPHSLKACFGKKIQKILIDSKYIRDFQGKIEGYGIKKLP
jgi:hypothetical protein